MRLTAKRTFVTLPLAARSTSLALNKRALFASPSLLNSYKNSVNNNKRFLNNKAENEIFKVVDFNDIQTLIKKEGKVKMFFSISVEKKKKRGSTKYWKSINRDMNWLMYVKKRKLFKVPFLPLKMFHW